VKAAAEAGIAGGAVRFFQNADATRNAPKNA